MESTLYIPPSPRTWDEFKSHFHSLLDDDTTHVYLDTSFLMWLTKVGTNSRTQLFNWLTSSAPDRIHVPVWTAHEYLKHYTKRTVQGEFKTLSDDIKSFAQRTYATLRPFMDAPLGPQASDSAKFRTDIRKALNTLYGRLKDAGSWQKQFENHTTEVLEFINSHTPDYSSIYSELNTVASYAHSRMNGSVPPGFKDFSVSRGERTDSNAFGDLLLWKEILGHAAYVSATGIILITNDLKNDWRMGSQQNEDPKDPELLKLRQQWRSVPRPHPMLLFEAKEKAGVDKLELIDSVYLAAYLKQVAETEAADFIDVAVHSEQDDKEKLSTKKSTTEDSNGATSPPALRESVDRFLFDDPAGVRNTLPSLRKAILASRPPLSEAATNLLDIWMADDAVGSEFSWTRDETLVDTDHIQLASVARALHDNALAQLGGSTETLADIAANIQRFPPKTASAVFLGFLSSMFLTQPSNVSRIPPESHIAEQLFRLCTEEFAKNAVTVLSRHLHRADERPLYIPSSDGRPLSITFNTEDNRTRSAQLLSMHLDTHEDHPVFPVDLLVRAETNSEFHLASIFGSDANVDASTLIEYAGRLYGFPTDSIEPILRSNTGSFVIRDELSFRDPQQLRIKKQS